jgi:hypothetical protein
MSLHGLAAVMLAIFASTLSAFGQELPGVRGRLYESPTYGFTVVWDPAIWHVVDATSGDGVDVLQLATADSQIWVGGLPAYGGDKRNCLDDAARQIAQTTGVEDVAPRPDQTGSTMNEGEYTVFDVTYSENRQTGFYAWYVECRTLVFGGAVLRLDHVALREQFDQEQVVAQALFDSIVLTDGSRAAGARDEGFIEIRARYLDESDAVQAAADAGLMNLALAIVVENVDIYPARLDIENVVIGDDESDVFDADRFIWTGGVEGAAGARIELAPGDRVSAVAVYVVPVDPANPALRPGSVFYRTSDGPVRLGCIFGCGGPGSSPRIRTGI